MTSSRRFLSVVPLAASCATAAAIFLGIVAGLDPAERFGSAQVGLAALAAALSGALAYWQVKVQLQPSVIRNSSARNLPGTSNLFQLPPDVDDFTGRTERAAELAGLLVPRQAGTAVPLAALHGKGGIGKTTLALHVAHRVRPHFPDGQIYVNLRGAESRPLSAAEVLTRFLHELDVDADAIPENLDDQARIYRAQLADRKVLLVLDNARNEQQIRPLLPGNPQCAVLVTSRTRLTGLSGAHTWPVDLLEQAQGLELLKAIVGRTRVEAELPEATEIVGLCGRLPLALRIAGARLSSRPLDPLTGFAARLRNETQRLDVLKAGDLAVRATFALSYEACDPALRRAFRLLGLVTSAGFGPATLSALAGLRPDEAEALQEQLVDAELIEAAGTDPTGTPRYRFHDLLRVFARERLAEEETGESRRQAVAALAALYTALATGAEALLKPGGPTRAVAAEPRLLEALRRDPRGWLSTERSALLAGVELAAEHGLHSAAWQLAHALSGLPHGPTDWQQWRHAQQVGLSSALADGSRTGEAAIRCDLGSNHRDRGEYEDAVSELSAAVSLYTQEGDALGVATASGVLGDTCRYTGRLADGIAHFQRALEEFRRHDVPRHLAWALNGLGDLYRGSSRWQESIDAFTECLQIYEDLGDRHNAARARIRFGIVYRDQCHYSKAEELYLTGLEVLRELSDRRWEARTLRHLGVLRRNVGRTDRSLEDLQQALEIFQDLADERGVAVVLRNLGDAQRRAGHQDKSVRSLEAALQGFTVIKDRRWEARTRISLADTHRRGGRWGEAAAHLAGAADLYRELSYRPGHARLRYCSGQLHQDRGERTPALEAFAEARAAFVEMGDHVWAARALARAAEVRKESGDRTWRELLRQAEAECLRHGARNDGEVAQWLVAW